MILNCYAVKNSTKAFLITLEKRRPKQFGRANSRSEVFFESGTLPVALLFWTDGSAVCAADAKTCCHAVRRTEKVILDFFCIKVSCKVYVVLNMIR